VEILFFLLILRGKVFSLPSLSILLDIEVVVLGFLVVLGFELRLALG
jgi:hypothetical protein